MTTWTAWQPCKIQQALVDRFWSNTDRSGDCWLWTAAIGSPGYGQVTKSVRAHRLSWEIHNGPIPRGMVVCHRCDVRACVNPEHLFLGTQADNMRDAANKGRMSRPSPRRGLSRITKSQLEDMREMRRRGASLPAVANRFGVSVTHADRLMGPILTGPPVGARHHNAKITQEMADEMRHLYAHGWGGERVMAKVFGVCRSTAKAILKHQSWLDIT